nr:MAG TPA: hypothetical protein [Caudoviricetes sp.]
MSYLFFIEVCDCARGHTPTSFYFIYDSIITKKNNI